MVKIKFASIRDFGGEPDYFTNLSFLQWLSEQECLIESINREDCLIQRGVFADVSASFPKFKHLKNGNHHRATWYSGMNTALEFRRLKIWF